MSDTNKILVKVTGIDKPGITAKLMNVLCGSEYQLLDMGQSVTHGQLSLTFLIKSGKEVDNHPVLKDLLLCAKIQNVDLDFDLLDDNSDHLSPLPGDSFILSCVSLDRIPPHFVRDISHAMSEYKINIQRIDKISPDDLLSLELAVKVPSELDLKQVKRELFQISNNYKVDIAFLRDNAYRRNKRLIVFDMDSTLIQQEVIDEIARECGVYDIVSEITEDAMNGKIDFDESIKKRVAALKGLPKEKLKIILDRLVLTDGVEEFVKTVKKFGYKVGIISGGFTFFANALKEKLNLDYAFANELEFDENGHLTGNLVGTIVNGDQKAILLQLLAQQEGLSAEQVVAIGDGANDLNMLATAGLGIAFHAKDIVRKKANQHMSHGPMTSILYFLGIPGPL